MSPGGYESESANSSFENLLESLLAEEEEFRRGRKKKLRDALVLLFIAVFVGYLEVHSMISVLLLG